MKKHKCKHEDKYVTADECRCQKAENTQSAILETVLDMVREERGRQAEKWGTQRHLPTMWAAILMEEVGEFAEAAAITECCDPAAPRHVFEKGGSTRMVEELVQVAAVAVQTAEHIISSPAEFAALRRGNYEYPL